MFYQPHRVLRPKEIFVDTQEKRWSVLACGCVAVDQFLPVAQFPKEGAKLRCENNSGPYEGRCLGGLAAMALFAAARVLDHIPGQPQKRNLPPAYCGALSKSEPSLFAIRALSDAGVDMSEYVFSHNASPLEAFIITTAETRTAIYRQPGLVGADEHLPDARIIQAAQVVMV